MESLKAIVSGLIFALGLTVGIVSEARTILYGSDAVGVTLEQGVASYFRFPLEVKLVTRAERFRVEPASQAQPDYALLSITPRFGSGASHVSFFLSDGSVVRVRLSAKPHVANKSVEDEGVFDFKPRGQAGATYEGDGSGRPFTELDLLRAMIRGDEAPGFDSKLVNRPVEPGFRGLTTRLVGVYSGEKFKGYIFELTSTVKKSLYLNIQNLTLGDPNLAIVSSVDSPVLAPKGEAGAATYLRVVAKPSGSSPPRLVLPVQINEQNQKK